jgi:hypothetical protein
MANITIYYKDGSSNVIPDFDLGYWQSQGWSTSKQSAADTSKGSAAPVKSSAAASATLTSADGKYKTAVTVGSAEASKLQNAGWKLGDSGKSPIDVAMAVKNISNPDAVSKKDEPVQNKSEELPDELANNQYFKQLDSDNQELIKYYWSILNSENSDKTAAFEEALTMAMDQADPYWKEKINIVKDELSRSVGKSGADLESSLATLQARKTALEEDLTSNTQYLTTEQQAELARQKDNLDTEITNINDRMATAGLSSSSIRTKAEEKLNKNYQDVIGSSTRAYEKKIRDTQNTATRELESIARQTADFQRQTSENKTSAVRTAESTLGSSELSGADYAPLLMGGVSGSLLTEKGSDILTRAEALMGNK